MKRTLVIGLVLLPTFVAVSQAGPDDEEALVRKSVLNAQIAGWTKGDYRAYMSQWSEDAKLEMGREEKPGKFDSVFTFEQIKKTRLFRMSGKPKKGQRIEFDDVTVAVKGKEAKLRCVGTLYDGEDYNRVREVYFLRKTPAGWKVYRNRGWYIESRWGGAPKKYDAKVWDALDRAVEEARTKDDELAFVIALYQAYRFPEALEITRKRTARKDANAEAWYWRAQTELNTGLADDAMKSFLRVLELDPKAPVPEFVRQSAKAK